jgi:excinuclease ABC subunit A
MTNKIMDMDGEKISILAPVIHGEKGTHKDDILEYQKKGFTKLRINGEIVNIDEEISLEKNIRDNIDVLIDKLTVKDTERSRIYEDLNTACELADGKVVILKDNEEIVMSEKYACVKCNYSIPELEPRIFSFNSPYGACPECKGIGTKLKISEDLIMPDKDRSLSKGAILPLNPDNNIWWTQFKTVCNHYGIDMDTPVKNISRKHLDILFYGTKEKLDFNYKSKTGNTRQTHDYFEGIIKNLERRYVETTSNWIREWLNNYMVESTCEVCHGTRLQESILNIFINKKNIYDLTCMDIKELRDFLSNLKLSNEEQQISGLLLKEINSRLEFLINVGLSYLTLARSADTLSGGEAQRIRLATQIGSKLSGVLYVLDEPSIGLHQRDNQKLIDSLKQMRDLGNTLVVVEHDTDTMLQSDYLVDIGPGAGEEGGYVVASGTPEEVMKCKESITADYLTGRKQIEVPKKRRKGNGKKLTIVGAKENNLNNITVDIPLGKFIAVTGVSGSGKSSLINEVLYKNAYAKIYNNKKIIPGKVSKITGLDDINKIIHINQQPIGRTPRSNPATYTGVFDDIRDLFSKTTEAKMKGYDKSIFSFNVKGGRCEACQGDGVKRISMQFLPDVFVKCEVCKGKRFQSETLSIKYKDKNIYDVLEMTVEEALDFFSAHPKIKRKLQTLYDVGLGYIKLGQSSTTLSGGEAQRIKLATEFNAKISENNLYIMDEPTTGLHTDDIKNLMNVINKIVDAGATVIIIEHNLDVIKLADYIIDMGPEGGDNGGTVLFAGRPEDLVKEEKSYTGKYLKPLLEQ